MVNEYYNEILTAISEHKDFGKRNPIDIGIELGYPEEDIMEMIRGISEASEYNRNSSSAKIYFVVNFGQVLDDDVRVVSVDIDTWKIKVEKKLGAYRWNTGKFDLKRDIMVWQNSRALMSFLLASESGEGTTELHWINFGTGEESKLLTDAPITQFKILSSGEVFVATTDEIILWDGKKNKKIYTYESTTIGISDKIIEGDNCIYIISGSFIYKTDEQWGISEIWDGYDETNDYSIGVAEYFEKQLYWWCYKEEMKFFADNSWSYEKYSEKNGYISSDSEGFYAGDIGTDFEVLEGIHTNNYHLMQNEIWSRDDKHKICDFPRRTSSRGNQGQVVAIKDRDIFIALKKGECALVKVDLQNERKVVTIPIEV